MEGLELAAEMLEVLDRRPPAAPGFLGASSSTRLGATRREIPHVRITLGSAHHRGCYASERAGVGDSEPRSRETNTNLEGCDASWTGPPLDRHEPPHIYGRCRLAAAK